MMFKKIGLALVGLLSGLVLFFRGQSQRRKAELTATQKTLANTQAANSLHRDIQAGQERLKHKHQQEQQDDNASLAAGGRDHLNNDW